MTDNSPGPIAGASPLDDEQRAEVSNLDGERMSGAATSSAWSVVVAPALSPSDHVAAIDCLLPVAGTKG